MEKLIFATACTEDNTIREALLLYASLRKFGGDLANFLCIAFVPKTSWPLSQIIKDKFKALSVDLMPFDLPNKATQFPFAVKVLASSEAETQVKGKTEIMVWMDTNTLVLNPTKAFFLQQEVSFAYRPVHHTLIGSVYKEPLDNFWTKIYQQCGITEDKVFPMKTCVRDNILRPYFNAGVLVLRPEKGLFSSWFVYFDRLYQHPDFRRLYEKDKRYKVFMHQAVLSAVTLKMFKRVEIRELPETINYPLHLHSQYPPKYRHKAIHNLITCRYEEIRELPDILNQISIRESWKNWINEELKSPNFISNI
jgi:hypothetical protein